MKNVRRMANRILSLFLTFVMLCTAQDITVFAQTADPAVLQAWADVSLGDMISFGSYPQTEVKGSALTDEIINAEYDSSGDAEVGGERYRRYKKSVRVTSAEYEQYVRDHYSDSPWDVTRIWYTAELLECENAKTEREGTYRYFRWEPIKWRVLENETDEGTLFVMADMVLDAVDYYDDDENSQPDEVLWEQSTLRRWMNTDEAGFYQTAFNGGEKEAIKVNAGNPAGDRIYLLSDEEVKNPAYGFPDTDEASDIRKMVASAYAEARGASVYSPADDRCFWYLRTPGQNRCVAMVDVYGGISDNFAEYSSKYYYDSSRDCYERTFYGCVPVMHIDASYGSEPTDPEPTEPTDPAEPIEPTEPEPTPSGDASSSDKSVLESLNFDIPEDSVYNQDELLTGTRSMGTMSELVLTEAGQAGGPGKTYLYDNDKNKGIRDNINAASAVTSSYRAGDSIHPYTITEAIDADGDGKKELLVQLYLNGTKRGQDILMTLSDIRTQTTLFTACPTGGYISTSDDIPPWAIEGLLSMCAGDFDGDGCEELAVYTPNNKDETPSGAVSDTLQIKIYKLGAAPKELAAPQQVIDIARVGSEWGDCQEWLYSHAGSKKQYYCLPYMQLTAGDMDQDGIDDLLTVASFSSIFRGAGLKDTLTWKQVMNPNTCFASVLDVYKGRRQEADALEQVVKKRVLVGRDTGNNNDWNEGCGILRNASVTIANVTGANSNEIVIGGNYTGVLYDNTVTENTTVTRNRYVWIDGSQDPKVLVGYVTAQGLLADNSTAASLSYNWTIHEDGYNPLHYYSGNDESLDPGSEPVTLDGFAAYGCEQPDTIALEGQLFTYSADDNKLKCDSFVVPDSTGKDKSNVWISAQTVGNVTNDPFGRETLYFTSCQKRKGKETYWNDVTSVWGVVNANGTKSYQGKSMGDGKSSSALHYTLTMCDIDEDSSFIKYEAGNTDVYYSNVQLLSVLQAAPVYGDLGDDYVSDAETSYAKSKGESSGTGHTHQLSAGVVAGFEHETSLLGLTKIFSMEATAQLAVTAGWEFENTAEKEFTTSYNTSGTEDVAVIYTVPYVRYNGQIYVPTYTLPTREEYDAKRAFCEELKQNIERYRDIKVAVIGGTYSKPNDGYNNEYTTNVTNDNYDYQLRTLQSYMEWLQQTESQMEGFEGSKGLAWGQEIEGGWEDYFFCIPQTPMITSVTVDTYNEIAAGCKDLQSLYGTALPKGYIAGRPETYVSNVSELKERTTAKADSIMAGQTNAGEDGKLGDGFISSTAISASSSAPSQTITFTEENAHSNSIGGSLSIEVTATVGEIKGGIAVSTDHAATWSSSTTNGCEFSGQVPNLPARPDYMTQEQYGKYDYAWKLVSYQAVVNGVDVPVVGYYTKYADRNQIPPASACNLELEEVKSNSITLTWDGGSRAADHYNVYQVSGSGAMKEYHKVGTVLRNGEGVYRFMHQNLQQGQSYTYVVAAHNADETVCSVYTDEITTTTPVPEFDVTIKLDGINGAETYLAGSERTLTANLVTQNYPQSEIDQYIWQVNDGSGWQRLPDGADQNSYTWTALAKADGYQYRCGAYVAVDSRLYRLYSEPVTLHVRKADIRVAISADKKEGATDRSSEFGVAVYNGDVLKLAAQVQPEEGVNPAGHITYVITDQNDASNVREYTVAVSETGGAATECRFQKAGRYTITARYVENERIAGKEAENSLSYYAYDAALEGDRAKGQGMEDAIYDQNLDDVTMENVIAKMGEIKAVKESYENLTDSQKELVETKAKEKLNGAVDMMEAAQVVERVTALGAVTEENAKEKKDSIDAAGKAYDALTDAQKALVPDHVKEALTLAQKAYEAATSGGSAITGTDTPASTEKEQGGSGTDDNAVYGTQNLTPAEKKQVDNLSEKLGISKKEAVAIWQFADSQDIGTDTLLLTEETILKTDTDADVKGSVYGRLQAKASKVTSKQVKLSWKKCKGADGYLIYRGECGKKSGYKLVKKITKASTTSFTAKKLDKGKGYRFIVRAYKKSGEKLITVSASKTVHVVTTGGKKVNAKSIKLGKVKTTLKKGKTLKLKASVVKQKKPMPNCRKLMFESSNQKIATVTSAGKVKAKAKGKCTIYIYAHNGLCKQVKITVK